MRSMAAAVVIHLVAVLLDVAKVVARDRVVAVEDRELLLEAKISLGGEQALDERIPLATRCHQETVGLRRCLISHRL
jgi:hypothetical protein